MYGSSRGAMVGSGGDGYEGSKRSQMMDSNPYFAVSGGPIMHGYGSSSKRPRLMQSSPYFSGAGASSFYQSYDSYSGRNISIDNFPVVRLRGLPFDCEELDVYKFFSGLDVVDCLLVNKNGRFSGEAFVVFASPMQAELALQKNRLNMGRRYIEVFECKKQDYYQAIAAEVNSFQPLEKDNHHGSPSAWQKKSTEEKMQMEFTEVLKLRGLPYSATKPDIVDFFGEFEVSKDNIQIAVRADGKATGEAYVEFASVDDAKKAMCKDKMTIGSRYVELFPSTPEEAKRAEARSRQ